mgnify:CR=1 FL=1
MNNIKRASQHRPARFLYSTKKIVLFNLLATHPRIHQDLDPNSASSPLPRWWYRHRQGKVLLDVACHHLPIQSYMVWEDQDCRWFRHFFLAIHASNLLFRHSSTTQRVISTSSSSKANISPLSCDTLIWMSVNKEASLSSTVGNFCATFLMKRSTCKMVCSVISIF